MKPINFPESNFVFERPDDMSEEQCGSLPVHKGRDKDGFPTIISCWELSPDDMEMVKSTDKVWIYVTSHSMPPEYVALKIFSRNRIISRFICFCIW